MQLFDLDEAERFMTEVKADDAAVYRYQLDCQKSCSNLFVNSSRWLGSSDAYYNETLKSHFTAVKCAQGDMFSNIICDEYVIGTDNEHLQHVEVKIGSKNTKEEKNLSNWLSSSFASNNCSKLTLTRMKTNYIKAPYWGDCHIVCNQVNLLLQTNITNDDINSNRYNVKCAKIFCCKQQQIQRINMHIYTALNLLQAITKFLKRTLQLTYVMLIILIMLMQVKYTTQSLLMKTVPLASANAATLESTESVSEFSVYNGNNSSSNNKYQIFEKGNESGIFLATKSSTGGINSGYLDKLDNLEKSLAAVLIKVAYGTTSTTKRSIPDNNFVPSLTTIPTPLLTTLRYHDTQQQSQFKHHRNYELDLERDHALPTSAPNADILKSNSNPTYPNPNRHYIHERDRHRHLLNSTPLPSLPNLLKKSNSRSPTISMLSGGLPPAYSPPVRSFFTPPLPPEYQHPFADKPTLRGTNNEGAVATNAATSFVQRRPIPPPSLMPGHERIPFRPGDAFVSSSIPYLVSDLPIISSGFYASTTVPVQHSEQFDVERKKALNTPSKGNLSPFQAATTGDDYSKDNKHGIYDKEFKNQISNQGQVFKEVIPSIRRILSGSNGRKSDVPDVLLKRVTSNPQQHLSSSPVVLIESTHVLKNSMEDIKVTATANTNINKNILMKITTQNTTSNGGQTGDNVKTQMSFSQNSHTTTVSTPVSSVNIDNRDHILWTVNSSNTILTPSTTSFSVSVFDVNRKRNEGGAGSGSSSTSNLAAEGSAFNGTWSVVWNIHIYLSVVLFTILAVYSLYKMITYSKLTHLFAQSYFVCIHLVLIIICISRIFYLCYDAYNIHASFPIFISEILLNLPSTFLTISFSVLVLFLSLKSLNHKNNRYSALIRPLTVIVGCGVHVILCITLHYVESYTLHQHYQQHIVYQQQQQLLKRHQMQLQQQYQNQHSLKFNLPQNVYQQPHSLNNLSNYINNQQPAGALQLPNIVTTNVTTAPPPPRVLSLICQIIYIFVCFSLGFIYLYLYRVLKRILRSKSQNYIHGYQNLSYAIHITIATALLFILLAALQIFGAISITFTPRSFILQTNTETDWLHWGYQFSLRLIEIAIITLISWVTGLTNTTSVSGTDGSVRSNVNVGIVNGEARLCTNVVPVNINSGREKPMPMHHQQQQSQQNHSTVAGFFLPCTSTSSQEQFENDYPVVCNANTNLHTYTMRTGKLIYDDSLALNSLGSKNDCSDNMGNRASDNAHQNFNYNNGPSSNHIINEFGQSRHHNHSQQQSQYIDYITDKTTDHYENPNFDLRDSGPMHHHNSIGVNEIKNFPKTHNTSTKKVLSSNESNSESNTNSAASQQQILLLQSDGSYSEPCTQDYEYTKFECATFDESSNHQKMAQDSWVETPVQTVFNKRDSKNPSANTLERHAYTKTERRSINGNYFGGGSIRFTNYNSYERSSHNSGVRKSETLITLGNIMHGRNASSSSAASSTSTCGPRSSASDMQSKLALSGDNRHYHHHHHNHNNYLVTNVKGSWVNHYEMSRINTHQQQQPMGANNSVFVGGECSTIENTNLTPKHQQPPKSSNVNALAYSDDDDDDELMLSAPGNRRL